MSVLGFWKEKHLSGLATLTLHDFHLAWPIHAFPPTQQPAAGGERVRQAGRQAGEILLLVQKVLIVLKPVWRLNPLAMMAKSDFNNVGWDEHHARFRTVAELQLKGKKWEKPGMLCHSSRLPISINGCLGVLFFYWCRYLPTCQASILLSTISICGLRG